MNNRSKFVHERFWSMVAVAERVRCWEWRGAKNGDGYGMFRMDGKTIGAHRVAYFLRNNAWPNHARHTCDNPGCCNPDHILSGTHQDNMMDRDARRRTKWPVGEDHGCSKLTEDDVKAMRKEYVPGEITISELGKKYGLNYSATQRIIAHKSWKHI